MRKADIDYSLYLVTDSTPAILGDKDICHVVEEALRGGVTIVQYRDKTSETGHLVKVARKLHKICRNYDVPLLINDRVDVALAVGCEGVHIGQDDMSYDDARRILGDDAIIGVSAGNVHEALEACHDGADYLGIGAMFATNTKKNTKNILGTDGVLYILQSISVARRRIPAVGIGGINLSNAHQVMSETRSDTLAGPVCLDGVAVVSAIMAAADPKAAAAAILREVKRAQEGETSEVVAKKEQQPEPLVNLDSTPKPTRPLDVQALTSLFPAILSAVSTTIPISHNMTNLVVQNFAANVALAVGASPIMANYGEEAADLARLGGALVINMGTVTPEGLRNYLQALKAYNEAGRPVVLDPVGVGATKVRKDAARQILAAGRVDVIKGNEGEIKTIYNLVMGGGEDGEQQRGVDSSATLTGEEKVDIVRELAGRLGNVVVMTGKTDYVSDGTRVMAIENGHEVLGRVTGTGCVLGTTISAVISAYPEDRFAAVVAGICYFEIAAERAVDKPVVNGPGSFVPAFLDELVVMREQNAAGDQGWLERVKVVET